MDAPTAASEMDERSQPPEPRSMSRRIRPIPFIFAAVIAMSLFASGERVPAHDRPSGVLTKTRSVAVGRHGMAASSQTIAALTAIDILKSGGNAIDAAIAANAVLGVVEPTGNGIGGDLFAIVWDAKSQKLHGLNASGKSPQAATIDEFKRRGLNQIPTYGPLSWSVPGAVDGWATLHKKFGTKPWAELLQPAIRIADEGYPIAEIVAAEWNGSRRALERVPTTAATFLPEGRAPRKGEIFRNPNLAASLRLIARDGRDAYYRGPIAKEIDAYSQSVDGLLRAGDLANHSSTWVEPVSTNYRGYDVWELPPNGQGIAVLQILNLLEPFDLRSMGFGSAKALHLMIEAKKLAFEDRARYYADPEKSKVPIDRLISKEYAKERLAHLSLERASDHPVPGDLPVGHDTIYLTVVDNERNAVSLIQSNYNGFGSMHVPGSVGFCLQNRGCSFALDANHANALEPGKRPFHTIIPAFVTKDGEPWLAFGLMGGDMQPQGHVQMIVNMIDFDMDVQESGDAARWQHVGSSQFTGQVAADGGQVALESGFSEATRKALESMGHKIIESRGGFGGYQAIRIDRERGVLLGGSDPRKDGVAIGY
jgi:gamma-glutamyltranspeptidase/glutathione hydrolase